MKYIKKKKNKYLNHKPYLTNYLYLFIEINK